VKTLKSGQVQGSSLAIFKHPDGRHAIKSNAMTGVVVARSEAFWTATIRGKATYAVPTPTLVCGGAPARKCGGYTFTVYVDDRQEPGAGADRYWIELRDPAGRIVAKASIPPSSVANARVIAGGNVQVPQPSKTGK
jgi:hypothetical protein